MRRYQRLLSLPAGSINLFLEALALVVLVRASLWVLPSRTVLRRVNLQLRHSTRGEGASGADVRRIAWAIRAASRRVPHASCLTQALAGQVLLARYGHDSQLRLGVARDGDGRFEAHAWVETEIGAVIGNVAVHRYAQLPDVGAVLR
jgi:hypothetical protein